jgi:glutamate racemase
MIEEGYLEGRISRDVIGEYLNRQELGGITSLILGCTHYPLIKKQIEQHYSGKVDVLDSAEIVAASLKAYLEYNLLTTKHAAGKSRFLVSDYTESFEALTQLFFGQQIRLEKYKLWE